VTTVLLALILDGLLVALGRLAMPWARPSRGGRAVARPRTVVPARAALEAAE